MNRSAIIVLLAILLGAVVAGVYFLRPAPAVTPQPNQQGVRITPVDDPYASQSGTQSKEAVQAAYRNALLKDNVDNIKLYQTTVSGRYALQSWRGDNSGGAALLKFDSVQNKWTIVNPGGGAWTVDALVEMGVPQDTASALLANMPR
jgi:hypothetical protein